MPTAFTVDRSRQLSTGLRLELTDLKLGPMDAEIEAHVASEYPGGLSQHGFNYLLRADREAGFADSQQIEHYFELARRVFRPDAPSRFQSMFASESVDDALLFRTESQSDLDTPIWEVHYGTPAIKVDMRGLNQSGVAPYATTFRAERYWQGLPNGLTPCRWELIIPLPVSVGLRIQ